MPEPDDDPSDAHCAHCERLVVQNETLIAQNARIIALLERAVDWMGRLGGASFDERREPPPSLGSLLDDDTPFEA